MKSRMLFILPPHKTDFNTFTKPPWGILRIPPVGLLAVGSYVYSKGHDVRIVDCRELIIKHKTNEYIQYIIKTVKDFKPNVIGINILTALFPEALNISCKLKEVFPDILIIAGGVHPSTEPELTFQQNRYIDAICIGPGEEVCLDVVAGKPLNSIPGLMHRDFIDKYEVRPVEMNIDKYPFPNFDLLNIDFYTEFTLHTVSGWGYRGLAYLTSRSCPYSCKFCASDWSKPVRYHSPEYVVGLAKHLSAYDVDVIGFFDDTIIANKSRLFKICEGFIDAKIFYPYTGLRWICAMRANQVTADALEMVKRAGCFSVSIGVESGNNRMLKVLNKKSTVEINRRACKCIQDAGMHLTVSFMVGIPGETLGEMEDTVAFMQSLDCNYKGMGCFRPLPGSPFYREFVNNGMLVKEEIDWGNLGDFSAPTKYVFCDVSKKELEQFHDKALTMAVAKSWTTIHEDTLLKYPKIVRSIASRANVRVCKPGNYHSSTHIAYRPLSLYALGNYALLQLYSVLPYFLRKRIRSIAPKLRGKPFFGRWLAGY